MTSEVIDKLKYMVCCPLCDIPNCIKDTNDCEAEIWATLQKARLVPKDVE